MPARSDPPLPPLRTESDTPHPDATQTEPTLGTGRRGSDIRKEIPGKWMRFYTKLVEERDRLIDSIQDLGGKTSEIAPDPIQDSMAEVGTESFQRDQLLGVATLDHHRLAEINQAIARVEDGTYGVCEATGKPIPEARLEAIPWARFSVEAEEEMEKRGEVPRASIGRFGSSGGSGPGVTADIVNQK